MKIAYFDCQFGAAGDMLLGALIDAGLDKEVLIDHLQKIALPPDSYSISITEVMRASILSKRVEVTSGEAPSERHLSDIRRIILESRIDRQAKVLAEKIFERLGIAEAAVHGVSLDEVHFHEVGAIDAIIDITGFAIGYSLLEIERSVVSAVPLGSGTVKMEHGEFPVPGPAVINLLKEAKAPIRASQIDFECLTPTAAAILVTVADEWGAPPAVDRLLGIGYGAGRRDSQQWTNVTRIRLGETLERQVSNRFPTEEIMVIEANLDDLPPQILSFATERFFEAGALDVAVVPAVMKKGRSGHMLSVLCKQESLANLQELILRETSSIGVRYHPVQRLVADRTFQEVQLDDGSTVRIKIARDRGGTVINAQPEFDDCARYAAANNVPLKSVISQALLKLNAQCAYTSASPPGDRQRGGKRERS